MYTCIGLGGGLA